MTYWEQLIAEGQSLDERASKIQDGETVGLSKAAIDKLLRDYHTWFAKCLSLLPKDLQDIFRLQYDGDGYSSSVNIKKFFEAATTLTPAQNYGFTRGRHKQKLPSYWKYPYGKFFYAPFLAQRQLLIEASERSIQTYDKHDTTTSVREQSMSKIKVLFLAANPTSTISLRLDEEMRAITEKIRISEHRDLIDVVSAWAVRPDDLLQALNVHKPQIVHFSGHGNRVGEIILVDRNGAPKSVSTKALKALFAALKDNIQVVILNACYSCTQAEAIIEVINCAVGMNDSIGDQAAIAFAASFYRALGFGRSVQDAFDQGKVALLLEGIPEENTPEFLVKEGIDPSQIILVSQTNTLLESSLSPYELSSKKMKRERLFNAYKVILNAADKYQFEAQQLHHMPNAMNISLDGVDEAVNEISLENDDTDVLPIFFALRGAFNDFSVKFSAHIGTGEEILKHRDTILEKFEELKTAMKKHLKELET
jgi:hypothetical protein